MLHQVRSSDDDATRRVDPFLMSVLKSRFEAIVREMTLVVMKASRSAVIKNAKDLSCAILTYDHRLVSTEEALPNSCDVHGQGDTPNHGAIRRHQAGRHLPQQLPLHRRNASRRHDFVDAGVLSRRAAVLGRRPIPSRGYRRAGSVHLSPLCTHHL